MSKPQTIQIFLPDGSPTSIKEATLTNRLIKTILFPRTAMDKAALREMVYYTGVYFLFGEDENEKPLVYIGEGENCWERIKDHHRRKDFWTHGIIAATKTDEYTKTEGKFLEHYCLKKAQETGRYKTFNDTGSREPSVPESRKYDLLDNFETIKLLVATLGYPLFEDKRSSSQQSKEYFFCKGKDASAKAILTDEGVLVLVGSTTNLSESPTAGNWIIGMRKRLIDEGVLIQKGNVLEFTSDQLFKSPSAAAGTILARRANGWIEWKDKNGKTLDELKRQ